MRVRLTYTDNLSPALREKLVRMRDPRPVLEAMGLSLVSITKRAFNDASLRATPWPAVKKRGAALKRSGTLWQSIRISSLDSRSVTVGTDRKYAVFHQLGTRPFVIRPRSKKALFWPGAKHPVGKVNHPGLPARPFFPFSSAGEMTPRARQIVESVARQKIASLLK